MDVKWNVISAANKMRDTWRIADIPPGRLQLVPRCGPPLHRPAHCFCPVPVAPAVNATNFGCKEAIITGFSGCSKSQ